MELLLPCLGFILCILLPLVVTLADEVVTRLRYRHIPGPPQKWLTGNIGEILRGGLLPTIDRWIAQYGSIFKLRLGNRLFVVVSDPDAVRTLMYKITNHAAIANPNVNLVTGDLRAIEEYGLVSAKDDYWRTVRTAWQPAFAPASLRGYQALMDREALALVSRLEARIGAQGQQGQGQQGQGQQAGAKGVGLTAEGGGAGGGCTDGSSSSSGSAVVEMLGEMSRTTLAVVGTAAYGVDFTSPEYGGSGTAAADPAAAASPSAAASRRRRRAATSGDDELSLVQACSDWFRTMAPSYRSKWALATAFPRFLSLMRHVASAFPDAALAVHIRARRVVGRTSQRLIDSWRLTHRQTASEPTAATATATETAAAANGGDVNGAAAAKGTVADGGAARGSTGSVAGGVAPGSFLGLMLAARDKNRGRGLSDIEIAAQVQTFMLAGFETTANALTFAVYHLALHPDKAAALRAELDEHLPPPPPPSKEGGEGEGAEAGAAPLTGEVLDKLVYTEAVIQEAMRLHPPAHSVSRHSDKPMKVLGYDIPAGTSFFIPINHLHHDDNLWPDAEAFRPERFLAAWGSGKTGGGDGAGTGTAEVPGRRSENGFSGGGAGGDNLLGSRHPHAYQPFGAGSRMCVGWRFAMQEAKTVLARLFQRLDFQLAPGQEGPLQLATGLTLAPKHGVHVRVTRRGE